MGSSLPSEVVSSEALLKDTPVPVSFFKVATGIHNRRFCGPEPGNATDGLELAVSAAENCLRVSRYEASDIDVVICCSVVRAHKDRLLFEPVTAAIVADAIGAPTALCFDVANACAGMANGLLLLRALIRSGRAKVGMVVSGEQFSLISRTAANEVTGLRDAQMASLTPGDAGMALVVDGLGGPADRVEDVELVTAAGHADLCAGLPSERGPGLAMYASPAQLVDERLRTWPEFYRDHLRERKESFHDQGFTHVIQHQVGTSVVARMNTALRDVFEVNELPPSINTVRDYGNTASTALFLTLHKGLVDGDITPDSKVLLGVFASGMVFGFVSLTLAGVRV
ncbi:3-oxoacyl-ACP synthase III family protein [Streptomyces sp. 2231.1]|uniref:3-oxoacyl-ACP synthase III family protein n=1 Tax=Streptomyces sp. 2231.1 TaxID=1855347 RepID=UPI000B889066|nr:3-oxoacyl-[acyl-carrier-protein] synthase III C-terminal domain-containing protein [Streptomyces sp. 2231.1]